MGRTKKNLTEQIEVEEIPVKKSNRGRKRKRMIEKLGGHSYLIDLRIHSPRSLGYMAIDGIDTAPAVVRLAKVKGLDYIAVTDYFSGSSIDSVRAASIGTPVTVIPGTVIHCTLPECRDVYLTCLFPESFGTKEVESFLRELGVPQEAAGDGDFVLELGFDTILQILEGHGGIAIPTTMDKTPYRKAAIPTLVEKYGFRVFDLSYYPDSVAFFEKNWPELKFNLLSFSSAQALAQIGNRNSRVTLEDSGFAGIHQMALRA